MSGAANGGDGHGNGHGPVRREKRSGPVVPAKLSDAAEKRVAELMKRYPSTKSAVMPALYIAQEECGWLTDEAIAWVAARLDLAPAHVFSVATFYTMYYKQAVGRYHIQICRTLSCMICGARALAAHLREKLGVGPGQVTANGEWSWEEVECLGSCGTAPMVQINDVFFENLTVESLDALMARIEREKPDLRFSTVRGELGNGMPDQPRSQVWVK